MLKPKVRKTANPLFLILAAIYLATISFNRYPGFTYTELIST